jgi:DNA-binding NarL/FixJ family response regulator
VQEDCSASFALIVEDHPLVADSLLACVHDCDAELKVDIAESLSIALRVLELRPQPALIVTDLSLPDAKGAEAVRRLREAAPRTPLLVFTALDDPELRREAKQLGASAYLIKNTASQALRDEIRALIGARPTGKTVAPRRAEPANRLLTPKQLTVLEELAAGRSNKEIAVRMNISDETVGSHMKEILSRLGAKNRTEAVVRYLQMSQEPHARSRR